MPHRSKRCGDTDTGTWQNVARSWRRGHLLRRMRLVGLRASRGLVLRLTIPFVVLITVVLLVLGALLGGRARDVYLDRLSGQMHSQALVIASRIDREISLGIDQGELTALLDELRGMTGSRITLIAADGTVLADSDADSGAMENHALRPEVISALQGGSGWTERTSSTLGEGFLYVAVATRGDTPMVLRVAVPLQDVNATVRTMQRWIWLAAGIAIVLSVIVAVIITGRIVGPLQQLRQQARAVAQGNLAARVKPVSTVEIGDLGRAFNTMVGRLASSRVALVRTQARMEAILSGLSDGVVLTDSQGNVLRLNEAAAEMFGADEDAATGLPFLQVTRDYELNRLLQSALAAPEDERRLAAIEHGLNRRTLLTTAHVIEDDAERLGLVVLRDISELRRLETVRREFVSNVSHELRTPLTSIRALVETLEAGAIDDPDVANDFLGRIVGEVDRLTALVEDLLDLGRLEAGRTPLNLAVVDATDLVQRGVDRLRPQTDRAQLKLTVSLADRLPRVEVDSSRVEQVLLNLVHNAIKFTPPGGSINVKASRQGEHLLVEVQDTGIGISETEQARLFERFYKSDKARRSEGTGLGLAIAKHIIQAHGGEISVRSEPGKGATFWFTLPVRQAKGAVRRSAGPGE